MSTPDLASIATRAVQGATSQLAQARRLTAWLYHALTWDATDYEQRTVEAVIYSSSR